MSPVKLVIFGEYWDSYLYRGRLHLFGLDSSLLTLDWNQLVEGLGVPEDLILAAECAFRRSDYFYSDRDQWSLLFRDPEIKALILGKFNRLAELKLVVEPASLKRFAIGQQDSPFPFPHTDLTIYNKKAYACSSLGVFEANCDGKTKAPVSSRRRTLWDAGALCVALSYGTAAIAAGAEGLYRLPIDYRYSENGMEPVRLSNHACNSCFWLYYSILGTSQVSKSFLADYSKRAVEGSNFKLELNRLIPEDDIFGSSGFTWGLQDKLYQVHDRQLLALRYEPWRDEKHATDSDFSKLTPMTVTDISRDSIVSASAALFGAVIETDDALRVIESNGNFLSFVGEPTSWRTFPRSTFYGNQLHVIWDDRLEIISFSGDYFVDQKEKAIGIRYTSRFGRSE